LYKKEKFTPYKQHYCCPDLAIQTLLPTFSNLLFMLLGKKIKWGIKPASSKEHITYDLQTQCYEYDAAQMMTKAIPSNKKAALVNKKMIYWLVETTPK
jgi:hypothetical protein